MATEFKKIADNWLKDIERDLVKNYDKLGLRASGKWAKSLTHFVDEKEKGFSIGIKGQDYTYYLENGRRQNKDQSKESLKKWVGWAGSTFLAKWVKDKGITANPYAVAWKIALEGWEVPNPNNAGGLVSDVVTKKRIQELNRSIGLHLVGNFQSEIIKELKAK